MKFKLLIIFYFLLVAPFFVEAKSYDFYVDASASGDEEGTEDDPFKEISDAIEEASEEGGKQEIYIKKGTYKEDVALGSSMRLYGKDEGAVKIVGTVTMRDGSRIENLTIDGGNFAVVVKVNADVEIKNCTIEDFGKTGVHTEIGGGSLVITGSKIRDGEGKGFYIQKGKDVVIIGNEVYDNGEEGIDIRENVDGKIQDNIIRENGESGIELVIGKADLKIINNSIKYNGSSGIATQFYASADEEGDVYISKNDIHSNNNYGVDCKIPQGGGYGASYWSNSIEMIDNNVSKNKLGTISDRCNFKIEKVVETEVEELEEEVKMNEEDINNNKEEDLAVQKAEENRLFKEENNRKIKEIERLIEHQEEALATLNIAIGEIEQESRIKLFFLGEDQDKIESLLSSFNEVDKKLLQAQGLLNEIHLDQEKEIFFREVIDLKFDEIGRKINFLNQRKDSFSIERWIESQKRIFFVYFF